MRPDFTSVTYRMPSYTFFVALQKHSHARIHILIMFQYSESSKRQTAFGFPRYTAAEEHLGWMFNFRPTSVTDEETGAELSAVDFFFCEEDGGTFKATFIHNPYFLILVKGGTQKRQQVEAYLRKKFDGLIADVETVSMEDLDLANHLSGLRQTYTKLLFNNVYDLMAVRKQLKPIIDKNKAEQEKLETYTDLDLNAKSASSEALDRLKRDRVLDAVIDIREYDVPYTTRVCIDTGYRVGLWYTVSGIKGTQGVNMTLREDLVERPQVKTLAFDIETTKLPLKFPNAEFDKVMMISYMIDGVGYLIVNREIVSQDIEDFEYTPKPEFEGPFECFNEKDELSLLQRFFEHIKEEKPLIYVTYNGDFFDWPFVEKRARHYGIDLKDEIGIWEEKEEYLGRFAVHMDAFCWVKRDSYLPQGSQGLKAVTKYKLKYNPVELDPEDMLPFAVERPQDLAAYSVSDAVATYYLYKVYVHLFVFSLCNIIPLPPSDVLRKGSGTLCELLLMVKASDGEIVCPNKQISKDTSFYNGHLLESETYIGGHVECLESGIFRADIPNAFRVKPERFQYLVDDLDRTLKFALVEEEGLSLDDVTNYQEVFDDIKAKLECLRDKPNLTIKPLIYHLDVGAMYPNIILTNRLQPMAIVDQATCATCDFNRPGKKCQRPMQWAWRGKYYPTSRSEYNSIKSQLEYEKPKLDPAEIAANWRLKNVVEFSDMPSDVQAQKVRDRVKLYSHRVYKKFTEEKVEEKTAIICQRENPFYVNTVRAFRDRRYKYKGLKKKWSGLEREAESAIEMTKAKDMVLLYDSLQLAHKCILNSFYGYVMRKGSRWMSIQMAGVVTKTGADIIKDARMLVEDIGRPLELDTDGIWAIIPSNFPEEYKIKTKSGKRCTISYPCSMLNILVNDKYTNHQYQDLTDEKKKTYSMKSECSIFFEVDGPYRAMVLPAAKEEGKNIKKRYAVFNMDGSLAELKGFEIKRRGELKLIKIFQGRVFEAFLHGTSLQTCYDAVGSCANHWLDVLYNKGRDLEDDDVFDLIAESKNMKEKLSYYGDRKSTAITTAKRLGEFLGEDMVKDKGLNCQFIITTKPVGTSTSARAVPVAIFSAEPAIKKVFLRKWLKDPGLTTFDVRDLLDWDYYLGRLGSAIQKIITIPAAFQKIRNPCPRVAHPDWLQKVLRDRDDTRKQARLSSYFSKVVKNKDGTVNNNAMVDIEDFSQASSFTSPLRPRYAIVKRKPRNKSKKTLELETIDGDDSDNATDAAVFPESGVSISVVDEEKKEEQQVDMLTTGAGDVEEEVEEVEEPEPDHETETVEWLNWQRKKWTKLRAKRKRQKDAQEARRKAHGDNVVDASGNERKRPRLDGMGLQSYFQQTTNAIKNNHWQIVQVVPEEGRPGDFKVWAFLDSGTLQSITVRVPRVFYLNTRTPNEVGAMQGRKVERSLPRGRKCEYLYEIEMPEHEYQENSKELMSFLTHSEVEGVYETQVPLLFKLLMEVGCVCKVDDYNNSGDGENSNNNRSNEFDMSQLKYKTTYDCSYLDNVSFTKIFLYQSYTQSRSMYGLFIEGSSELLVIVVNPRRGRIEKINLQSAFIQAAQDADLPELTKKVPRFRVRDVSSKAEAYELIRNKLYSYRSTSTAPSIVMAQTSESLSTLYHEIPILKTEFPVVCLPVNDVDNQYPQLNWFSYAAKRLIQRCMASGRWWEGQLAFCRYAHVPIGNVEKDSPAFVSDLLYARVLKESNHLLWMSDSPLPDLGGLEEDENYFEGVLTNPEITNPGCYRDLCFELEITHLAVNTMLQHSSIEELEGGMGLSGGAAGGGADGDAMTGGSYQCRQAFMVLKNLITTWFDDVMQQGNTDADFLLQHFYRYLTSPNSKLYDPFLTRMVHVLMKKYFMQLLARFRKLGSNIVYATFTKLIISTGKPTIPRALAYWNYINKTITDRPMFNLLTITPTLMWESLIFMDSHNYGGIIAQGQGDIDEGIHGDAFSQLSQSMSLSQENKENEEHDSEKAPHVVSEWNIARYLPALAEECFLVAVGEFIVQPYLHTQSLENTHPSQANSQSNEYLTPEEKKERFHQYISDLIDTHFNQRLFEFVTKIMKELHGDVLAGDDTASAHFPRLAGSYLPLHHPGLEYIKSVTYVLGLDATVSDAVRRLRENLLRLIDVRSFSADAQFKNPCLTYVLPDVICSFCNQCRDLDLCRDPDLIDHVWKCAACEHPYDKMAIESELVRLVNRKSVSFQVQDLVCSTCGSVKQGNLNSYCPCSGKFKAFDQNDAKQFKQDMRCFGNIAEYHKFRWLKQTVQWFSNK